MNRQLPAGMLDHNVELFNDPENIEKVYALMNGRVYPFSQFPFTLKHIIAENMAQNPVRVEAIKKMGYNDDDALMQKYVSCTHGGFDGDPDIINGKMLLNEHWDCPNRATCPGYGIVCNALQMREGDALTPQEIKIIQLVADAKLDKEIADLMEISFHTVKQHLRNIRAKTGCMNKMDMLIFCYQKNLA